MAKEDCHRKIERNQQRLSPAKERDAGAVQGAREDVNGRNRKIRKKNAFTPLTWGDLT